MSFSKSRLQFCQNKENRDSDCEKEVERKEEKREWGQAGSTQGTRSENGRAALPCKEQLGKLKHLSPPALLSTPV